MSNDMNDIDDDVIKKAAQGDIRSFEKIYLRYESFVHHLALCVVRQSEDAQEITQDVFLKVYHKLSDFQFKANLKTWIYRITVNTSLNYAQRHNRQKAKITKYEQHISEKTGDAMQHQQQKERYQEQIEDALKNLTEEQRICIVLKNIHGLSYQEIADTLQINLTAVKSRLKRAREALLVLRKNVKNQEVNSNEL